MIVSVGEGVLVLVIVKVGGGVNVEVLLGSAVQVGSGG